MVSADQIPVWDVQETPGGPFDWSQSCVGSTTLCNCNFFPFWLLFPLDFFLGGKQVCPVRVTQLTWLQTGCKSHSRDRADESSCAWRSVTLFICRIWTLRVSGDRSKHKTSSGWCSLSHCVDLVHIVDPRISLWSVLVTKWKKPLGVTEVDKTAGVFMQNWLGCSADFVAQSFSF